MLSEKGRSKDLVYLSEMMEQEKYLDRNQKRVSFELQDSSIQEIEEKRIPSKPKPKINEKLKKSDLINFLQCYASLVEEMNESH